MNRIEIKGTNLVIKSDADQWMICKVTTRKVKKERQQVDEAFKYYPTLESCVKGLGRYLLNTGDATTIDELVSAAGKISMMLSQNFTASAQVKIK